MILQIIATILLIIIWIAWGITLQTKYHGGYIKAKYFNNYIDNSTTYHFVIYTCIDGIFKTITIDVTKAVYETFNENDKFAVKQ